MYAQLLSRLFGCVCFCVFFFFSSRRRHTRFDCDWSSDVCSSDLLEQACATLRTEAVFTPRMAADERGERRRIWRARVGDELARARAPGRSAALEGCA